MGRIASDNQRKFTVLKDLRASADPQIRIGQMEFTKSFERARSELLIVLRD